MKTLIFTATTFLAVLILTVSNVYHSKTDTYNEEDAIRSAVQLYVDGVKYSDASKLESAFHEDWRMTGFYEEGHYENINRDLFIRMIGGNRDTIREEPLFEGGIKDIKHHDRIAIVKIHLENERVIYTDFLSLLKVDGEWTIVNKIWDTVLQK